MATFGPVILGPLGWQQINRAVCHSWLLFKQEVESVFGLSPEQLKERFFTLSV